MSITIDVAFQSKAEADAGGKVFAELEGNPKLRVFMGPAASLALAVLEDGMESGLPSVVVKVELNTGEVILMETSARLLCTAARAIEAKYPNLFTSN